MTQQTKVQRTVQRIAEQRKWIDECGGDLAGYLEHYGAAGEAIYAADLEEMRRQVSGGRRR